MLRNLRRFDRSDCFRVAGINFTLINRGIIVANLQAGQRIHKGRDTVAEGSVVISPRGVERIRAGHLWVYRSDVRTVNAEPGAVVRVTDDRGRFQGRAFYSDKSQIAIRLLTRDDEPS